MMKFAALMIVVAIFFSCNQKVIKKDLINKDSSSRMEANNISIENEKIKFLYTNVYNDTIFDKIHGYHKMACFLSTPAELIALIDKCKSDNNDIQYYINSLKVGYNNGTRENAIAVFSEYLWRLIVQIYETQPLNVVKGNIRSVEIPLNRFEKEVLFELQKEYLYTHQITVMTDYENCFDEASELIIGDKMEFKNYVEEGMESIFAKYVLKPKADSCASYPFTELPINIDKALSNFDDEMLNKVDIRKHLNQYKISPKMIAQPGKVPEFEINFNTDFTMTNVIRIPIPVGIRTKTRKTIYVENAARAIIGNLLNSGISRELIIIVKLEHSSHRKLFKGFINSMKEELDKNNGFYRLNSNAEFSISNPTTIFYRLKIIPNHFECASINAVNKAIRKAKGIMIESVENNSDTKYRYMYKNSWPQVLIFQAQEK